MFVDAMAGRYRKAADPVICAVDKIGETIIRFAAAFDHLLPQHRQAIFLIIRRNHDVIAIAASAPEASDAFGGEPFFVNDLVEHRLRIAKQVARAFPDNLVGQDGGIIASEFPGAEKRRPVDIIAQVGQIPVRINMQSRLGRSRRLECHIDVGCIGPRFFERRQFFPGLARARDPHLFIILPGLGDKADRLGVADQL